MEEFKMEESGEGKLNYDIGAVRDRHVRLRSMQADLALGLPPSVHLPHGEQTAHSIIEPQFYESERVKEIRRMRICPPPNVTIVKSEPIPIPPDWPGHLQAKSSTTGTSSSKDQKSSSKKQSSFLSRTMSFLRGKRSTSIPSSEVPSTLSQSSSNSNPSLSVLVPSHRYRQMSLASDITEGESTLPDFPTDPSNGSMTVKCGDMWVQSKSSAHLLGGRNPSENQQNN